MNGTNNNFALQAEEIHKTYKLPKATLRILCGASLTVAPGEHVAITGKSGSGKSTLLNILGGLDKPDSLPGTRVAIKGRKITCASERLRSQVRARDVGFVFQAYNLMPEMNIVENVMLPSLALPGNSRDSRARALHLLELAGLADRLSHLPKELSGGEQQRVAIARAMMNSPALILADEPTGNLDPATGNQILDMLFGISKQEDSEGHGAPALVMVTHSTDIAGRCDRIVRLEDGRLVEDE